MMKYVAIGGAFLILVFTLSAQQAQAPQKSEPNAQFTIPAEAAKQANPVKATAESIDRGKKTYGYDCAMCHGEKGDGKGDLAADMKVKIADFTDPAALKERTDGELFYIIKNGKGQMPPEGDRGKPNDLWDLINYVRSLAKVKPAEAK